MNDQNLNKRVSVCLAAYNGMPYIKSQIKSILVQLSSNDELVVTDDCSNDGTYEWLNEIDDGRLIVVRNNIRLGYVKNFEKCIKISSGDIVFLSDQDDYWKSDKIKTVINIFFLENPVMVAHGFRGIHPDGAFTSTIVKPSSFKRVNSPLFLFELLWKVKIWGCCIAFDRSLLKIAVPFPNIAYAHDHWLAAASFFCGKIMLLPDDLIYRTEHDSNVTPKTSKSLFQMFLSRVKLFVIYLILVFRKMVLRRS
ncbi:glycosyltransferase [Prosthecochloris sp. HL-130-GSB]|uniref:glycosyltransferase n=1 Tax=Prosthecochloris sp. HL-130-GSB TaxID=1974213 RepID=UPI000A1C0443|nr:glycosyltransferase [Prosthecochloris sp. HL-130-GSB]ARM31354.1 hypothetical protein B9H02_08700 [Prosthecochloris sp. HL-130-GSB]